MTKAARDELIEKMRDAYCRAIGEEADFNGMSAALAVVEANSLEDELAAALRELYCDTEEYARINNLGGYNNHNMKRARAVLAVVEAQIDTDKARLSNLRITDLIEAELGEALRNYFLPGGD